MARHLPENGRVSFSVGVAQRVCRHHQLVGHGNGFSYWVPVRLRHDQHDLGRSWTIQGELSPRRIDASGIDTADRSCRWCKPESGGFLSRAGRTLTLTAVLERACRWTE